ncbi:acyltransferase [Vreelandella profundi]|uniref:acyltransferase n=1 Tax=Vreelandella profundi TaxID=2852117 RepID=UPI002352C360|nr:acyltransferase [Halomonas profundi]
MKKLLKLPKYIVVQVKLLYIWSLFKIAKTWVVLNRIHPRLRPAIWRLSGCHIGGNVSIGYDVYYDVGNADLIRIEDGVWITSRSLILCHRRDISDYKINDDMNKLPYIKGAVTIKKGASIGMGAIIMPGVTVGEGAMVGAGSVVTKDIPAWSIAVGNPAKVIRFFEER